VLLVVIAGAGLYLLRANPSTANNNSPSTTPTATPSPTPGNTVTYSSSLTGTETDWRNDTHCSQRSDGYHVAAQSVCPVPIDSLGDGHISVQVEAASGPAHDYYGLIFRATISGGGDLTAFYLFGIDTNGQWFFGNCTTASGICTTIQGAASAAIHKGLKVFNTIAMNAKGSHFIFSINGQQVGEADDSTYSSGPVGLISGNTVAAVFKNIAIAPPQ
jgi:hypothetical protein